MKEEDAEKAKGFTAVRIGGSGKTLCAALQNDVDSMVTGELDGRADKMTAVEKDCDTKSTVLMTWQGLIGGNGGDMMMKLYWLGLAHSWLLSVYVASGIF